LVYFFVGLFANASDRLVGKVAPSFGIKTWIQSYKADLDMKDLKGKVIYIATFQDGCPYCHRYGLPALQALEEVYKGDKDVQLLAIQTAFEDEGEHDIESAKNVIDEYGYKIPVGNSARDEYDRPVFMDRYETGGTPWVIVIDKEGIIRYSDFQLHEDLAMSMIERFKAKKIKD
jgi:thiol-disulfide isomerase/thioredoxin